VIVGIFTIIGIIALFFMLFWPLLIIYAIVFTGIMLLTIADRVKEKKDNDIINMNKKKRRINNGW